jgi:ribonuclease D
LCLIQVATRERVAVVDPLALPDISPIWDVVNDPAMEVVMHAAGEDLRIDRLQAGRLPQRVVDVQIAAGLVGYGYPASLGNLVRQELGISLPSGETRTDWRRRPLSPAQARYALDDVAHLLDLSAAFRDRLARSGRSEWAEEEYRAQIAAIAARDDEERWRRLPGLNQLSRRSLEAARRLADWRLSQARRTNRPVRQVLRDDVLVAIAKRLPATRRDLEALRDFQRPHLLAQAREILDRIAQAQAVPADELPHHGERRDERPGLSMLVSLLSAALNQCCAQYRVASGLTGSSNDLRDLVRWYTEGRPDATRYCAKH